MSEVELVSMYHEAISVFFTVVTLMTSLLFAYLVAMFFMAHRLGIALFTLLNVLYVCVCFAMSGALLANGNRAAVIGQEILALAAQAGSGIAFQSLYALGALLFVITLVLNVLSDAIVRRFRQAY